MKDSFRGVTTFSIKKLDRDFGDNLAFGSESSDGWEEEWQIQLRNATPYKSFSQLEKVVLGRQS